jgi:hypothetical protein
LYQKERKIYRNLNRKFCKKFIAKRNREVEKRRLKEYIGEWGILCCHDYVVLGPQGVTRYNPQFSIYRLQYVWRLLGWDTKVRGVSNV